ncbi:methyltransferase-like protein [Striga asiatica]|uniref:Methyltransferase-like protein n=1 Tax=Striga asiatica TaxID=4170 RepID=A0A5A7PJH5_STRAF|nr:methyltransferase-like protein [Striga asiatica]
MVKEREEKLRDFNGGVVLPLSTDEIVQIYEIVLSELTATVELKGCCWLCSLLSCPPLPNSKSSIFGDHLYLEARVLSLQRGLSVFCTLHAVKKMASRPELQAPPEIFYNDDEARKYTSSSRIIDIQAKLSERALELLALPEDGMPRLLLDIGCGSGLSGETLTENGHHWIGLDISPSMLDIALEREAEGDLILGDMGQGLGLRPGVLDGAISISAVQWLCNADKSSHEPRLRLKAFFGSLYRCLARGARAVLQVYPENLAQRELILGFAMRAGFSGGVVVDYPHRYVI